MQTSQLLNALIEALRCLPGVGPKSAQRMAFHLLKGDRSSGLHLATILQETLTRIGYCESCRTFTEASHCGICANPKRALTKQLCIIETPADIIAIEQTGQYSGQYFVLMGHLSPIDGIGPLEIGLNILEDRLQSGTIEEIILATNPTIEGDVTANYIAEICAEYHIMATRIAHGVPVGGELDMVDGTTLSHSFIGRQKMQY